MSSYKYSQLVIWARVFRNELKLAIITPLEKQRILCLLTTTVLFPYYLCFLKIIERLMYTRLLNSMNKHKILNKLQFGFRNNHSTFMALVVLIENLVNALDNEKSAAGIVLDFQKPFDTVDNGVLLDNLVMVYCYGIRGTANEWFISYLSSSQQSVMYYGHESELKVVGCDVPQGSIGDLCSFSCILMI